ncbi:biliverdin-producing heme oxygenase [Kosakonia cowanii]|nr:biliverdin-producing heme oxygenase [Kosakonia cowanii]
MNEAVLLDEPLTRSRRLKAATHESHDRLDKRIMAGDPFADRERYGRFLDVQYRFHHEIDRLYRHDELCALIPDLQGRRRLGLIRKDMEDIGTAVPDLRESDDYLIDVPSALGWLYVAEGSNLGAAFLLKEAAKLGLSEEFGARHLAGAPEGRGRHWRTFTAALDGLDLDPAGEDRLVEGAREAFARVRSLVDSRFGD